MSSDDDFATPLHIQRRKDIRRQRYSQPDTSSKGSRSAQRSKSSTDTPGPGKRQRTPTAVAERRQAKLSKPSSTRCGSVGSETAQEPVQQCPICGANLSRISADPSQQQQHVNFCLDQLSIQQHDSCPARSNPPATAAAGAGAAGPWQRAPSSRPSQLHNQPQQLQVAPDWQQQFEQEQNKVAPDCQQQQQEEEEQQHQSTADLPQQPPQQQQGHWDRSHQQQQQQQQSKEDALGWDEVWQEWDAPAAEEPEASCALEPEQLPAPDLYQQQQEGENGWGEEGRQDEGGLEVEDGDPADWWLEGAQQVLTQVQQQQQQQQRQEEEGEQQQEEEDEEEGEHQQQQLLQQQREMGEQAVIEQAEAAGDQQQQEQQQQVPDSCWDAVVDQDLGDWHNWEQHWQQQQGQGGEQENQVVEGGWEGGEEEAGPGEWGTAPAGPSCRGSHGMQRHQGLQSQQLDHQQQGQEASEQLDNQPWQREQQQQGRQQQDDEGDVMVVSPPRQQQQQQVSGVAGGGVPSWSDTTTTPLAIWLAAAGAGRYLTRFTAAAVDLVLVPHLVEGDLQALGVDDAAVRRSLMAAAARLVVNGGPQQCQQQIQHQQPQQQEQVKQPQQQQQQQQGAVKVLPAAQPNQGKGVAPPSCLHSSSSSSRAPLQPLTNLLRQVAPHQVAGLVCGGSRQITAFFTGKTGQQQTGANKQGQQQQQQQQQRTQQLLQQQGPQQQQQQQQQLLPKQQQRQQQQGVGVRQPVPPGCVTSGPLPRGFAAWRTLPGTRLVVDCFGPAAKGLACRSWFLTHFHADHYGGLTKGFKQGTIYCTPVTAALAALKLKVPLHVLRPLPLGVPEVVEGTRVTLLEANHCPGSAMILAEPAGGGPPVLHTGDARLSLTEMQAQPQLAALAARGGAVLVLDTTYCDPQYTFPSQAEVVAATIRAVKAEAFNPRTLFLFGTYTIGKERLFLSVADALDVKLYVAAAKRGVLGCIGLTAAHAARLTTNHLDTNYHVVPMNQVNFTAMEALLARYKGRYTAVVGVQPTGWAQGRASKSAKIGKRSQRGTLVLYQMPYSEHSSYEELRAFVAWLHPSTIIPSVGNDAGPKAARMLQLLTAPQEAPGGPMDAFVRGRGGAGAAATGTGAGTGAAAGVAERA